MDTHRSVRRGIDCDRADWAEHAEGARRSMESLDSVATIVWLAVGTSVAALIGRLIQRGSALLLAQEAKVKNQAARDALEFATAEAARAAATIVASLNQAVVDQLKAQGKWDAAAANAVKARAAQELRNAMSSDGKAVLEHAAGDLGRYLDALIEAHVAAAKKGPPAAGLAS